MSQGHPPSHLQRQRLTIPLNRLKPAPRPPSTPKVDERTLARLTSEIVGARCYPPLRVTQARDAEGRGTGFWWVEEGEEIRLALRRLAFHGRIRTSHPVQCQLERHEDASRAFGETGAVASLEIRAQEPSVAATLAASPSAMLQAVLAQDLDVALVATIHAFVVTVFFGGDRPEAARTSGEIDRRHAIWRRRLPAASDDLLPYLIALPPRARARLLILCLDRVTLLAGRGGRSGDRPGVAARPSSRGRGRGMPQ